VNVESKPCVYQVFSCGNSLRHVYTGKKEHIGYLVPLQAPPFLATLLHLSIRILVRMESRFTLCVKANATYCSALRLVSLLPNLYELLNPTRFHYLSKGFDQFRLERHYPCSSLREKRS
jgi:hypothetical protein